VAQLGLVPNVALSLTSGREAGTDRLFGFTVGLRIPLFHRQQGATGQAAADRAQAQADRTATERAIRAEVLSASARYQRARTAEHRFETEVLQAAAENVRLTERAVIEGEVSLTDVLVLRNTALAAQLEYLDVLRDAADAWFTLAAALGAEPADLPALLGAGG
jgi:cobalt-zinc-cadmium efflux system outer membrane protein